MPTVMVQSRFVDGKLLPNMSIRFLLNIFAATFLRDICNVFEQDVSLHCDLSVFSGLRLTFTAIFTKFCFLKNLVYSFISRVTEKNNSGSNVK